MTSTCFESPLPDVSHVGQEWGELVRGLAPDTAALPLPCAPGYLSVDETIARLRTAAHRPPAPRTGDLVRLAVHHPWEGLLYVTGALLVAWMAASTMWWTAVGGRPYANLTILGGSPTATRYATPENPPPAWVLNLERLLWFDDIAPETDEDL